MEDYSDTASNKSYMLVNAKGPNFDKSIVMPLGYNTSSTMNTQSNFVMMHCQQWCPPTSQRYRSRDTISMSARSVADFRTRDVQRYPRDGRCASPMSVRSTASTTSTIRACALVEALKFGEFNISDERMIYKEFCRYFKLRRNRKSYRRHMRQSKARRLSRDDTSAESSDRNSDSSDCMSTRTVRTAKSLPRNVYEGSKENMRRTLHNVRNDIKNGNIFSDRSGELQYNSLRRAVSGRLGNAYLDTSDSEPNPVSECTENVSRVHLVGSKNDIPQNVASVPNRQFEKPIPNNNHTRKNMFQKTSALNHTWATQKERFENSWANNNSLQSSQRSRFENCRKVISAPSSVYETTKQTNSLNVNKENTLSTNTVNSLSVPQAFEKTGGNCDDQSSNKENTIQINNVHKQYNLLATDSEEELFPKRKGSQNKTSVSFDISQATNNARSKASQNKASSLSVDTDNFKVPSVPTKKSSMRTGEKLISKSSQPLDSLIDISPEKRQSTQSDFSVCDTDRSEVSSRPSFAKRKLYSTKLSMVENANISTENSADSPNSKMYSALSNTKNKTKKIAKNQSCLTRDINENEDVMDLLGKLMPGKNITGASKTNEKELNAEVWDAQSILSQCNGSNVSETFSDYEDELLGDRSNCKANKENNVLSLPATSTENSRKSNKSIKKHTNDGSLSNSKSKTEMEKIVKAKSRRYFQDKSGGNTPTAKPAKKSKPKTNKEIEIPTKICTVNLIDNMKPMSVRCVGIAKPTNTKTATPAKKSPKKSTAATANRTDSKDDTDICKGKLRSPAKQKKDISKINANGINIKFNDNTKKTKLNKSINATNLNNSDNSFTIITRKRTRMENETSMNVTKNSDSSCERDAKRSKDKRIVSAKNDSRNNSLNSTFNMTLRPRKILSSNMSTSSMSLRPKKNLSSNLSTISDPMSSMSTFSRFNRSLRSRQADILAFFKS